MKPLPALVVAFLILAGLAIYEARLAARLAEQNQALQAQLMSAQQKNDRLQHEQDAMHHRLASQANEISALSGDHRELLKLNEEVSGLRKAAGSNDVATAGVTNEAERLTDEAMNIIRRANINFVIEGKFLTMKHRLNLTAQQETAMKGVLEKLYNPEKGGERESDARKHFEKDLTAFLSPDQMAVVSQMEKDEKLNQNQRTVRDVAEAETQQLEILDLTPDQQTAAIAAMVQIQTKAADLQADSGNLTHESSVALRNEKLLALKDILTDEQFVIYKKYFDEEARSDDLFEALEKIEKSKKPGKTD